MDEKELRFYVARLHSAYADLLKNQKQCVASLNDVAGHILPDGTKCWCSDMFFGRSGPHQPYCRKARTALASAEKLAGNP